MADFLWQTTKLTLNLQFLLKGSSISSYLHATNRHPHLVLLRLYFISSLAALNLYLYLVAQLLSEKSESLWRQALNHMPSCERKQARPTSEFYIPGTFSTEYKP